ncbi:HYR domain-containing protein [Corallococcus exercitus]|uniref:HYR domain-containing protein n=1 Tax=Corallococcus exercitus TaxID=2316736 RepID=UPI0035D3F4EC
MKRRMGGARAGALVGLCALGFMACTPEEPAAAARPLETRAQGVTSVEKVTAFSTAQATKQHTLPGGFTEVNGSVLFFSRARKGLFRTDGTEAGTSLVRDLEPTVDSFQRAPHLVTLGGRAYWLQQQELWTSDGTPEGTRLMLDTPFASSPTPPVVFNGALYFSVGTSLYRSDGTAQGTQVLATAAMKVTEDAFASGWRVMGNRLYFACTLGSGSAGVELCATDGTGPGTVLVADVGPGSASGSPSLLGEINGQLLFSAASTSNSRSLYATDGSAGPIQLLHVANNYTVGSSESGFATLNGRAYMQCTTPAIGTELCATDGTAAGTQVLDLVPGSASSNAKGVTRLGDRLYFSACTTQAGCELWSSDGTTAGSAMLKEIIQGTSGGFFGPELLPVEGGLIFVGLTSGGAGKLWRTDGTAEGTVLLKEIVSPQASGSRYGLDLTDGVRLGDVLFFPADDGFHGQEVWRTDGTPEGTRMVADVTPVQREGDASRMQAYNDWLLMGVSNEAGQTVVWRSDGTAAGTQPLSPAMGASSYSPAMAPFGDRLLIARGPELWMTDATAAGTVRFKALPGSGAYGSVTQLPNQVGLFIGSTPYQAVGLWRTDGTDAGTHLTDPGVDNARNMGVSNGRAYLTGLYSSLGNELYASDGTPGGTVFLKDIWVGSKSSEPAGFTPLGSQTLFFADDGVAGRELWKTDGTPGGTARLADLNPGAGGSAPSDLHPVGDRAVFWTWFPTARLWTTDGTAQGTQPVGAAVTPGYPGGFVTWGDVAFFSGKDNASGTELWRTDGTLAGTVRVADLQPGRGSSLPDQLTLVSPSGPLLFVAEEGAGGREPWRLDSPTGQPTRVADVVAGPGSSRPEQLTVNGSAVYFSASDGTGRALFRLSGLVPDTRPPRLTCPPDVTVSATNAAGAVVTFPHATVHDDSGEVPTARTDTASGGRFPVGVTPVTFTATDGTGNAGTCTFTITVKPLSGPDAGTVDAGVPDAGTVDAGVPDAGVPDAGSTDAGTADAGSTDAGTADAGPNGPGRDAGTGPDGPETDSGGCGCQATPASMPWGLALAALFASSRRSRKRR